MWTWCRGSERALLHWGHAATAGSSGKEKARQELNGVGRAQVEKDLANITQAMTNATFARFVKDPCISRKAKGDAMAQAVAGADETTRKLAGAPLPASADHVAGGLPLYQGCTLVCTQACTLRDCALLLPSGCLSVSLSLCRSVSLRVALLFICLSSSPVSPLLLSLFLCGLVPTVLLCDDGPQFYILRAESLSAVLRDMGLAPTPQSLILHLSTATAMLCENGRVDEISKVYVMCVCVCVCVCV